MKNKKYGLPSYVYKLYNTYVVEQQVNKKKTVYGKFKDREEAIKLRDKLVRDGVIVRRNTGWHRIKDYEHRYIQLTPQGTWLIQKWVDGHMNVFGTYHRLEDAMAERDYMESIGWDYDNME